MEQDAPFAVQAGDDRPVTDISWFEARIFPGATPNGL